jgi:hypothetical protein
VLSASIDVVFFAPFLDSILLLAIILILQFTAAPLIDYPREKTFQFFISAALNSLCCHNLSFFSHHALLTKISVGINIDFLFLIAAKITNLLASLLHSFQLHNQRFYCCLLFS